MSKHRAIIIYSVLLSLLFFFGGMRMLVNYNISTKYTIENIATETLGVRVTIGELHLNQEQGTARLGHVQIFNPKGFSDGAAVEIENIDVTLEPSSRGLIRISEIAATNIQVNLEVKTTRNNLSAISHKMANIKLPEMLSDTEKLKIIVDSVSTQGSRIRPRALLVSKKRQTVPVPDVQLSQIGYTQKGLLLKVALAQTWSALIPEFEKIAAQEDFLDGMQSGSYEEPEEDQQSGSEDHLIGE